MNQLQNSYNKNVSHDYQNICAALKNRSSVSLDFYLCLKNKCLIGNIGDKTKGRKDIQKEN